MSSPHLPPEILDLVVGHLHDTRHTLRNCCLVAKSWLQRTRKHLFANVDFPFVEGLQSWKETFLDPSTSPARYAKTLSVGCPEVVTAADANVGGWIRGFSRVEHLDIRVDTFNFDDPAAALVPFHGLSPIIKSLRVDILALPHSPIINLISSFPLLEDLAVTIHYGRWDETGDGPEGDETLTAAQPLTPSMFTGTLELHLKEGAKAFVRRLLSLPGGIHFRKLAMTCLRGRDLLLTTELVEACSRTLESLDIAFHLLGKLVLPSVDLSKATKLKDVVFQPGLERVEWVIKALQTITPEHRDLLQLTIDIPLNLTVAGFVANGEEAVGEQAHGQWLDLDRLLVQFWESRSIRPKVVYTMGFGMRDFVESLLPEITKRGVADVDLVERPLVYSR